VKPGHKFLNTIHAPELDMVRLIWRYGVHCGHNLRQPSKKGFNSSHTIILNLVGHLSWQSLMHRCLGHCCGIIQQLTSAQKCQGQYQTAQTQQTLRLSPPRAASIHW